MKTNTNKGKRRVKQNIWGNWNGYEGTRKVKEFGCNALYSDGTFYDEIQEWLDGNIPEPQFVLCEPDPAFLIEALRRIR